MSPLMEKLAGMGCDMNAAWNRFLHDADFFEQCFRKLLEDPAFEALGSAIQEHDKEAGFEYSHMLKGIIVTVGLTPMYQEIEAIVEPLRAGQEAGVQEAYGRLMSKREQFLKLLEEER